ncbi:MAG: CBS domain-containing protein [Sneathiellaceae bacterium]
MLVEHILRAKGAAVVTARPDDTLLQVARVLSADRIGAVLILDGPDHIAGVLSERDIVRCLARDGTAALELKASDAMTADVVFCAPEDSVDQVMDVMTQRRFRHLPVRRNGKLIGLISIGDVVKIRMAEQAAEAEALKAYIASG